MAKRQKQKEVTLPAKFRPQFWNDADGRCAAVKEIRRRYEALKVDAGVDCVQKDIISQRATFLLTWLETQERQAVEKGIFDPGPYTQAVNSLLGLLKTLGLERKAKKVSLRNYVSS